MVHASAVEEFKKDDVELTVPPSEPRPILIIVMGPASWWVIPRLVGETGKSTVGNDVAESLSIPFIDGDSLHPQSNIDKMSSGIPLTDDDRLPWLALIRSTAERVCKEEWEKHGGRMKSVEEGGIGRAGVVIACSALKKWYRDILRGDVGAIPPPVDDLPPKHPDATAEMHVEQPATSNLLTLFCYCQGTPELLAQRIAARQNHFMGAQMLASQLATLEDPTTTGESGVFAANIDGTKDQVKDRAVNGMRDLVQKATHGK